MSHFGIIISDVAVGISAFRVLLRYKEQEFLRHLNIAVLKMVLISRPIKDVALN